ncbi:hypothetical protein [Legionella shakespearei]|uniref:Uncharacterized protein n=1 Tax=Legionella shakespearei DSM 23087 TaxID=1122169 RepID=A0A0W0YR07_9GAMM|nr:hypothetical protein [Legionella shakespearei]KTD59296.1 hypothetical protein Lsha_1992 [Legionella shakespearei DSM 23087]
MKCNENDLFYNMDDAVAEFYYWCKFIWLTIDQITALTFRKNPDIVNLNSIRQLIKLGFNTEFTHEYVMRYRLIEQAQLGLNGAVELSKFIDWALLHKLDIPEEMKEVNNKINSGHNRIHPRTEATYQNIIAALLEYISGKTPGIGKHPSFTNESQLIDHLADKYQGYSGMSVSSLSRKLPLARNNFK